MIPELPEKEVAAIDATKAGAPPVSAPRDERAPKANITDLYERDVLDLVTARLDAGVSEGRIVDELCGHDFGKEEARRLVRALADDRPAPTSHRRRSSQNPRSEEDELAELIAAEILAGNRQMLFGMLWLAGGLILTVVTFAARAGAGGILFWGAVVYGIVDIIRGSSRVANAKKLLK